MPNVPYLQYNQGSPNFTSLVGLAVVPPGLTVLRMDRFFHLWSQQIDDYTGTTFETVEKKRTFTVPNDGYFVVIGSWQHRNNLTVKLNNQLLTENTDFAFKKSDDGLCVIALDFSNYNYLCAGSVIEVEGTYGWQAGVTFDVENLLVESMNKVISASGGIGHVPKAKTSEKSKNTTATFEVDTQYLTDGRKLLAGVPIYEITDASCLDKYRSQTKPIIQPIVYEKSISQFC